MAYKRTFVDTRFEMFNNCEEVNKWLDEHPDYRVVSWRLLDKHFNIMQVQYTRPEGFSPIKNKEVQDDVRTE